MAHKQFCKMVDIFIPYSPGDFRQRRLGVCQREFSLGHSPLNNIVDGRYMIFFGKLMADITDAGTKFFR